MDTDDLSEMAYVSLKISEKINHILTLELGGGSRFYKTEDTYLKGMLGYIRMIRKQPDEYIDSWGLENEINAKQLTEGIKKLEKHILKTLSTPLNMRGVPR